mgnify:CR=1 FL=1
MGWIDEEGSAISYANADAFIAVIVSEDLAKYTELRDELTLEEAVNLHEIAVTNRYNEYMAIKRAQKK